jgi:cyclase
MLIKTMSPAGLCLIVLLGLAGAVPGMAQNPPVDQQSRKDAGDTALKADLVKTGLYVISGGGGNSLVRLSANGLIVVDGKLPGNYDALCRQVKKMSDQPVRILINTNYHEDRTGNNARFLEAGTVVLAQENVARNLAANHAPGVKTGAPTKTYDREFTIRLGGIEAQMLHFGNAHTSGDSVVYFANLKVVAVGDLYTRDTPEPDFSAGGSMVGWGPVLGEILKLDFDVAIPSVGPTVTRQQLEALKVKVDTMLSRATALVAKGVTEDQLMSQLRTDDLGWRFKMTGDTLDRFYAELVGAR